MSTAERVVARVRGRLSGKSERLNESDIQILKTLVDNGTPIKNIAVNRLHLIGQLPWGDVSLN